MSEIKDLNKKKISELIVIAKELGVESTGKKDEIIKNIIDYHLKNENKKDLTKKDPIKKEIKNKPFERSHIKDARNRYKAPDFEFDGIIESEGVLDIMQEGYGFLRSSDYNYLSSPDDIYVSQSQVRLFGLKTGDTVLGQVRPPKEGEKYFPLIKVSKINGLSPDVVRDRVSFQHLTPLFPEEKFNIADKESSISTRIMDLFSPIGKGQRGMIVSQPKTGKTMLLEDVANAISEHYLPTGLTSVIPKKPFSYSIAIVDKIDSLVGFFLINEKPTSSKDPFALRRSAIGLLRIIIENKLSIRLGDLINYAIRLYEEQGIEIKNENTEMEVLKFLKERMRNILKLKNIKIDIIEA